MRIVHGPKCIATIPYHLAEAERALGHDSICITEFEGKWRFPSHRYIDLWDMNPPNSTTRKELLLSREVFQYDVYHLHYGESLLGPQLPELRWLKALGKTVFMHFHGCDLRDSRHARANYKYTFCTECWPMTCSPNRREAVEKVRRYVDGVFVSTHDLLEYYPGSVWLPQAIDTVGLNAETAAVGRPHPRRRVTQADPFVVAHAPSDPAKKGTRHLVAAIERLQAQGVPIVLRRIEGFTHADAMAACASADIVVDQLMAGIYSVVSCEMMAIGRPVICYTRDDLRALMPPELPIISANPDTIEQTLRDVMAGVYDLGALAEQGRAYALRHHDRHSLAERTIQFYEEARRAHGKAAQPEPREPLRKDLPPPPRAQRRLVVGRLGSLPAPAQS